MTDFVQRANAAFVDGDVETAVSLAEKAIAEGDGVARREALLLRSAAYYQMSHLKESLADAEAAVQLGDSDGRGMFRKAAALVGLGQTMEGKAALKEATKSGFAGGKLYKELVDKVGGLEDTDEPSKAIPQAAPFLPPAKIRHEWFQSETFVTIAIFIKGLPRDDSNVVRIDYAEQAISVTVKLPSGSDYMLELDPLFHAIIPSECKHSVMSTKIEIKLRKKVIGIKWAELESSSTSAEVPVATIAVAAGAQAPAYPSSSKKKTDWDSVVKNHEDDKPEGEAALQELFKNIYKDANDDTRRAMMKSFQESGGTVLSTNWAEIGKEKVKVSPPEGMEAKKKRQPSIQLDNSRAGRPSFGVSSNQSPVEVISNVFSSSSASVASLPRYTPRLSIRQDENIREEEDGDRSSQISKPVWKPTERSPLYSSAALSSVKYNNAIRSSTTPSDTGKLKTYGAVSSSKSAYNDNWNGAGNVKPKSFLVEIRDEPCEKPKDFYDGRHPKDSKESDHQRRNKMEDIGGSLRGVHEMMSGVMDKLMKRGEDVRTLKKGSERLENVGQMFRRNGQVAETEAWVQKVKTAPFAELIFFILVVVGSGLAFLLFMMFIERLLFTPGTVPVPTTPPPSGGGPPVSYPPPYCQPVPSPPSTPPPSTVPPPAATSPGVIQAMNIIVFCIILMYVGIRIGKRAKRPLEREAEEEEEPRRY